MEIKNVLHMTKGDGEFSYAHNSNTQSRAFGYIKPLLENAVSSVLKLADKKRPYKIFSVADLGCGVGSTPISLISIVTSTVHNVHKEMKSTGQEQVQVQVQDEIQIFMSDLPSNDFNLLFKQFEENDANPSCFVMAKPGSFYARLFPSDTLHLVVSNYAIHWLSQVPEGLYDEIGAPLNKNGIGASIASHPQVLNAYYARFHRDFTTFLNCRSHEVVSNGYMILATYCRPSIEPFETRLFNFIFQALACMVSKGAIEEEDLDTFNLPIYFPCKEEINEIVNKQGSFEVEYLEVMKDDERNGAKDDDPRTIAEFFAKTGRSITESLVSTHFGGQVWDELYGLLYQVVSKHLERNTGPLDMFNIIIVLKKK